VHAYNLRLEAVKCDMGQHQKHVKSMENYQEG